MGRPQILWGTNYENILLCGWPLDNPVYGQKWRDGSQQAQTPGGVEASWVIGEDYTLDVDIGWIPDDDTAAPIIASGWASSIGVMDFLHWARQKTPFRLVPDNSFPGCYVDGCYLVDPLSTHGTLQFDGSRRLTITIRNTTYDFGLALRGLFLAYEPDGTRLLPPAFGYSSSGIRGYRGIGRQLSGDLQQGGVLLDSVSGALRDRDWWNDITRVTTLEMAVQNQCNSPEDITVWFSTGGDTTASANAIFAPNRAATADKLIEGTLNQFHARGYAITITAQQYVSASIFVRAGERSKGAVYFSEGLAGANKFGAAFDTVALTATAFTNGLGVNKFVPTIRTFYAGWREIRIAGTVDNVNTTVYLVIRLFDNAGSSVYAGDGTSGAYFWGAMIAKDRAPSSYYNGLRPGDGLYGLWNWAPQQMWMYIKFTELGMVGAPAGQFPNVLNIGNLGAYPNWRHLIYGPGAANGYSMSIGGAGVQQDLTISSSVPVPGETVELLARFNADTSTELRQARNAAADVTAAGAALSKPYQGAFGTNLAIGSYGGGPYDIMGLQSLKIGCDPATINTIAKARAA